eukprot:6242543-Amphidinium_carterae.1
MGAMALQATAASPQLTLHPLHPSAPEDELQSISPNAPPYLKVPDSNMFHQQKSALHPFQGPLGKSNLIPVQTSKPNLRKPSRKSKTFSGGMQCWKVRAAPFALILAYNIIKSKTSRHQ